MFLQQVIWGALFGCLGGLGTAAIWHMGRIQPLSAGEGFGNHMAGGTGTGRRVSYFAAIAPLCGQFCQGLGAADGHHQSVMHRGKLGDGREIRDRIEGQ
jgi:hypothetical protein